MNLANKKLFIVYRGPLERTRLAFIFELLLDEGKNSQFIWIFPGKLSEKRKLFSLEFLGQYFSSIQIIENRWHEFFTTIRELKCLIPNEPKSEIAAIGYSSLQFLMPFRRAQITWFVNGIPEEKTMHGKTIMSKIMPSISWIINRLFSPQPNKIITVSKRMSSYVARHFPKARIVHAPTCVDLDTFNFNDIKKKGYLVYCGSGAPWQAIDLLSAVWQEIHKLDPLIKFRVISRDERCKLLSANISSDNIEFVQSNDHKAVADYLNECTLAFMLRRNDIVNRVCFPTKFAQYIASGCAVITTNIDWDIKDYMNEEVGLLVDPLEPPRTIAEQVLKFYNNLSSSPTKISSYADKLDRKFWVNRIKSELNPITKTA